MLAEYFPILLFLAISIALGAVLLSVGAVLGPRRPDSEKLSPYECGFEAFEDTRSKFDVRYYLCSICWKPMDSQRARPKRNQGDYPSDGPDTCRNRSPNDY